jgi:hypothetical protein
MAINIKPDISLSAKPPTTMTLPEIVGLARGAQAYQRESEIFPEQVEQARQATRTGAINLGVAETTETERRRVERFFANPENFQTNGRLDMEKVNSVLPTIAPLTGRQYMTEMTTLMTAQTSGDKAKTQLNTDVRNIISSRLGVLGRVGITDKNAYLKELDLLAEQYPNNSSVQTLVNSYKTQLKGAQDNDPTLPQVAIREADSLLSPAEAASAFAPKPATVSTGATIQPTVVTPSVGGRAPRVEAAGTAIPITLGPSQRVVPTGRSDPITNEPTAFVYGADGRLLGEVPISSTGAGANMVGPAGGAPAAPVAPQVAPQVAPSMAPKAGTAQDQINAQFQARKPGVVSRIPPGETPESMAKLVELRESSNKLAGTVPEQLFNYGEMIKFADQTTTGRGAEIIANLTGGFAAIPLAGDMATDLQTLGHYMKNQTAVLAGTSGMNTDAARSISEAQVGTTNWTPAAIKNTARVNRALVRGSQMFNRGLENVIAQNQGNIFAARDYRNKWGTTLDINALRLLDAMESGDTEGLAMAARSLGGPESDKYKKAKATIPALKALAGM